MAQPAARALTPAFASVAYILSLLVIVLAGAMLVPTFVAALEGAQAVAAAFALTALGGSFVAGGVVFAMQGVERQTRTTDIIALVTLAWLLLPIFAAIPLAAAHAARPLIDSYFEAMAAFTTTGATALRDLDEMPKAILVWRALLAWLGGYASVVMTVAVLSGFGTAGEAAHRSQLPLGAEGPQLTRIAHGLRDFLAIYFIMTVLGVVLLWFDGMPALSAFLLAFSTIATAGLSEGVHVGLSEAGALSKAVLMLLMIFGATSFLTHRAAWRGRYRAYAEDIELRLLGVMFLAASCIFLLAMLTAAGAAPRGAQWAAILFDAVSVVTTTGLWQGAAPLTSGLVLAAVAFALIGGASMSTAGGVKLARFALLIQQGRGEVRRLTHPRGVVRLRYQGRPLDPALLIGVWALFAAYVGMLALATLALCFFGLDLMPALVAAASALSNTGPLYPLTPEGSAGGYAALPEGAKLLLAVVMAAGRLEVLALLSLISAAYWRR